MSEEKFEVVKPYKWMENIEREVTDNLWEDISAHFGVEEITELTEDQVQELEDYWDEIEDDRYLSMISMGVRNIISWWENEANVDD